MSRPAEVLEAEHRSPAPDPATLLVLRGIHKRWGDLQVLEGVDLDLRPGDLVALTGPNGAGKTTLLRIATGLILPDAGEVRLRGLDPERERRAFQRLLGYLPAGNGGLYARLTVRQNLEFWAGLALLPRERRARAVDELMSRFKLDELASRRVDRMSMGQRQRVRLATTFVHDPEVVLLDEPATSLDDEGTAIVVEVLAELAARGGAAIWCAPSKPADVPLERTVRVSDGELVES